MESKTALASSSRRETFLEWGVALFCIAAGLTGLRIVNDADLWKKFSLTADSGIKAGVFRRLDGGVRLKLRESPLWHDLAEKSQDVFGGDTVFTAGDGKGEIQFLDGSVAQILPDSLVVIRAPEPAEASATDWLSNLGRSVVGAAPPAPTRIQVIQGAVKVHLRKNTPPPVLIANEKSYAVSASTNGVTDSRGETDLELRVGGTARDPVVTLASSSGANVGGEALTAGTERVIAPTVRAAPVISSTKLTPPATMPSLAALPMAAETVPAIVSTAVPAPLATVPVAAAPAAPPRPKPKFVALPTLEATSGSASTLAVDYDHLDRLTVVLRWKPLDGAVRYRTVITDDHLRAGEEKETKKPSVELVLKSLRKTHYFYRVRAELEGGETIVSPLIPIVIQLAPPLLKSPEDRHEYVVDEEPLLTWAKTVLTQGYQVQIARDTSFARPELDESRSNNFSGFPGMVPGRHFWRVRMRTEGNQSEWSAPRSFVIPQPAARLPAAR